MLNDLYLMESFYGQHNAAPFFSDLSKRYGLECVAEALKSGDILYRPVNIGPDQGRRLICLSEKGRKKVHQN